MNLTTEQLASGDGHLCMLIVSAVCFDVKLKTYFFCTKVFRLLIISYWTINWHCDETKRIDSDTI